MTLILAKQARADCLTLIRMIVNASAASVTRDVQFQINRPGRSSVITIMASPLKGNRFDHQNTSIFLPFNWPESKWSESLQKGFYIFIIFSHSHIITGVMSWFPEFKAHNVTHAKAVRRVRHIVTFDSHIISKLLQHQAKKHLSVQIYLHKQHHMVQYFNWLGKICHEILLQSRAMQLPIAINSYPVWESVSSIVASKSCVMVQCKTLQRRIV